MDKEELKTCLIKMGCKPDFSEDKIHGYSSNLIRCGCGKHSLTAVVCGDQTDKPVKLLASAVSWFLRHRDGRGEPLVFVVGRGKADEAHVARTMFRVLQLVECASPSLEISTKVDFKEYVLDKELGQDLFRPKQNWLRNLLAKESMVLPEMGRRIQEKVSDRNFRWYRSITSGKWSGRIDGLKVCVMNNLGTKLTFDVGQDGKSGKPSAPREWFLKTMDATRVRRGDTLDGKVVFQKGQEEQITVFLQELIGHKGRIGASPGEHYLEARILRGEISLKWETHRSDGAQGEEPLQLMIVEDGHPYQFPARWDPEDRPRFVDVLAREGDVPWVVELKDGRSQGSYYREGIPQAVLYQQFIRNAETADPWFARKGLRRKACRAALVVPGLHGPNEEMLREDHRRVGKIFGVEFLELPREVMART